MRKFVSIVDKECFILLFVFRYLDTLGLTFATQGAGEGAGKGAGGVGEARGRGGAGWVV